MAASTDSERIRVLEDIEAIKKLKVKYWHCIDRKLWDELATCFAEDGVLVAQEQNIDIRGGNAISNMLKERLEKSSILTIHQGHNPNIEIATDTTAKGTWTLQDYARDSEIKRGTRGWALYEDEYVKEDGKWKIKRTQVSRIHTERFKWDS